MFMWFSTIFSLGAPVTASVHVCSPCSLNSVSCIVVGVVFAGQSDVLSATRFLAVVFFFVARAELISSRRTRSRGVSVVINLPRCGFAASCGVQRCCVFPVLGHLHYYKKIAPDSPIL